MLLCTKITLVNILSKSVIEYAYHRFFIILVFLSYIHTHTHTRTHIHTHTHTHTHTYTESERERERERERESSPAHPNEIRSTTTEIHSEARSNLLTYHAINLTSTRSKLSTAILYSPCSAFAFILAATFVNHRTNHYQNLTQVNTRV